MAYFFTDHKERVKFLIKKIVLWIAVILLSIRIFDFSAATAKESSSVSEKITKVVVNVVKQTKSAENKDPEWEKELFEICHKIVRKSAHFSLYALLAILTYMLARCYDLKRIFSASISASYCLIFAISDETHQLFVKGRSGQISDVLLDFCGAMVGIGLCAFIGKWLEQRKKRI